MCEGTEFYMSSVQDTNIFCQGDIYKLNMTVIISMTARAKNAFPFTAPQPVSFFITLFTYYIYFPC